MIQGEAELNKLVSSAEPRRTIAGYITGASLESYYSPGIAQATYFRSIHETNLSLTTSSWFRETRSSKCWPRECPTPLPQARNGAWAKVHFWIRDMMNDIQQRWHVEELTVFVDCNPSFGIYTEMALLGI